MREAHHYGWILNSSSLGRTISARPVYSKALWSDKYSILLTFRTPLGGTLLSPLLQSWVGLLKVGYLSSPAWQVDQDLGQILIFQGSVLGTMRFFLSVIIFSSDYCKHVTIEVSSVIISYCLRKSCSGLCRKTLWWRRNLASSPFPSWLSLLHTSGERTLSEKRRSGQFSEKWKYLTDCSMKMAGFLYAWETDGVDGESEVTIKTSLKTLICVFRTADFGDRWGGQPGRLKQYKKRLGALNSAILEKSGTKV